MAAPPLSVSAWPAVAAAAPLPPLRTSALVMRPRGPVPVTVERSMPSAAATRAATGETFPPDCTGAGAGADGAASGAGAAPPAPSARRAMTWPTVTVSPSPTRISVIVPAAGAGSSMSTLSVETSTTVWPSSTASPTLTAHSRIVPSVTDSPPLGVTMSMTSVSAGASGSAADAAGPAPLPPISASSWPTWIVSPSATWILASTPLTGEGTSASTLSVETSTSGSSASTWSPSCFSHVRTVPSVTDSPIAGMVTCVVVSTAMRSTERSTLSALLTHEFIRPDEGPDGADDGHRDGEPQRDDPAPQGDQRGETHGDPAEAVGHAEDELQGVQPRHQPHGQKHHIDGRMRERGALEAREGHRSSSAIRRSGSSAPSGHAPGAPRPPADSACPPPGGESAAGAGPGMAAHQKRGVGGR